MLFSQTDREKYAPFHLSFVPPLSTNGLQVAQYTKAYNVKSEQEVCDTINLVQKAGARIVKEPKKVFWGGCHAYFADPDGYYKEVTYNPYWSFD
ncbi:MAG: hypothetical protein LBF62_00760 [Tannerellaceae bacterium]|nr:hypothetical protein [Tannerellaceae bacterium]